MLHQFDERRSKFTPYGLTCELWKPLPASRPDSHDELEINFVERGTITYLLGGQRVAVQPRQVTMFWASIPHQTIEFHDVSFYYVVTIPFSVFLQWKFPENLLTRLIMGELLAEADSDRVQDDSLLFKQWNQDLERSDPSLSRVVQMEMAARILRFGLVTAAKTAATAVKKSVGCENTTSLGKAEQMASYVARNYQRRLQIKEIADAVSLHPDYASTLFRQAFGATLTSLIAKHRVADAQRRLLTTDDSIMTVALDAGFDSLTRFNRAFKEIAKMTPREFRKRREWVGADSSSD
jgi:AraC family transcriptional regulator, melibiose operon regulatory protein